MSGQGGRMTSWLRRARDADGAVIAELYLAAFRAVYDFPLAHTDDEVRAWVRDVVVGTSETWVVVEAPLERAAVWPLTEDLGEIAGFVTISPGELDQLYIRPDSWGRGHGSRLLAFAKVRSPEGLDLYTFQANARARAFYERHAFEVVDLDGGERNEERQPDIRYRWTAGPPRSVATGPVLSHVRSADGTRIAMFSSGDGPPLVLIHGATADHTTFRVVGPMFARHHATHAIDRRGRGASGDGPSYAIEREYEDVAAIVDSVAAGAGGPVDVVAHSFGGAAALGAATLTSNIRRLAIYESAAAVPGLDDPSPAVVERLREMERAGDRVGLLRGFMTDVVGVDAAKLAEFEASPVYHERVAAAHTVLRELTAGGQPDEAVMSRLAAAVRVPVLQLLGGASLPFFGRTTLALDHGLADGRVVILAGQRHAAHHEAADVFVAEVEAFLGR